MQRHFVSWRSLLIHEEGSSFILKKFSDISISDGTSMKVWGIWQTNLIAVGLTLDVFAYCLYKGAMVSEIRKKELLKKHILTISELLVKL